MQNHRHLPRICQMIPYNVQDRRLNRVHALQPMRTASLELVLFPFRPWSRLNRPRQVRSNMDYAVVTGGEGAGDDDDSPAASVGGAPGVVADALASQLLGQRDHLLLKVVAPHTLLITNLCESNSLSAPCLNFCRLLSLLGTRNCVYQQQIS